MPVSSADIVVISDGEDDEISFVGPGSSRLVTAVSSRPAAIFVDSASEVSEDERLLNLSDLLHSEPNDVPEIAVRSTVKGKGRAREADVVVQRASIIDSLDGLGDDATEHHEGTALSKRGFPVKAADEIPGSERPKGKRRKPSGKMESHTTNGPEMTKEERDAVKVEEKREKQLAKDAAKAAKEAERSYQKKVAEVNKLRTSKNDTVREIHLYLSHDLSLPSSPIAGALPEIRARLTDNLSELLFLDELDSPVPGTIKFRRHLKAKWDGRAKRFVPLDQPTWVWEGTVLIVVPAAEVVDKIAHGDGILGTWLADNRLTLGLSEGDQVIVIVKGLQKYYAKTKTLANREFTAAARAGIDGLQGGGSAAAALSSRPAKEVIERELVKLQVEQGRFLVHVEKTEDIEDWVCNLAADIAIRPYKLLSKSHLNFAPTDHQRKGSSPTDAFELMLQQVQGITPSAAAGIAAVYPTFRELMEGYEKAERRGGVERAERMLADCEIKNLRNGTASGRKLNKALAKRIYHVFRGDDSLALA